MKGEDFNRVLNGLRLMVGTSSFATPHQAFRGAGLDTRRNPQMAFMIRMFGVRDLVLGAGALATEGDERRRWLMGGVAADVGDAVAALAGVRAGYLSTGTGLTMGLTALGATAIGLAALAAD